MSLMWSPRVDDGSAPQKPCVPPTIRQRAACQQDECGGSAARTHPSPIEITRCRGPFWRFRGRAFVDEALAAEAELQAMLADYPHKGQQR